MRKRHNYSRRGSEAESALAHVGRTLNDELDTARVRERRKEIEREEERKKDRKGVRKREPWREKKEKGKDCNLMNAYSFLSRLFHPRRNK